MQDRLLRILASAGLLLALVPRPAGAELACAALPDLMQAFVRNHVQKSALDAELESRTIDTYLRRVDASRTLQTELFTTWKQQHQPAFEAVPDLATVQRPAIDAATRRLLEELDASLCALAQDDARAGLATPPASVNLHRTAWTMATDALWPVPDHVCRN